MKYFKKILSLQHFFGFVLLFFWLAFCVGGCIPKEEWVFRYGPYSISSGEYNFLELSALLEANAKVSGNSSDPENVDFDLKKLQGSYIEKEPAIDWVQKEVRKRAYRWLISKIEYDKMNLSKSEEADSRLKAMFSQDFDGGFANLEKQLNISKYGLSKKTLLSSNIDGYKMSALLTEYFGEGKPLYNRINEEAVENFMKQNFIKFKSVKISKNINSSEYSEKGNSKPGARLAKVEGVNTPEELFEKYKSELNAFESKTNNSKAETDDSESTDDESKSEGDDAKSKDDESKSKDGIDEIVRRHSKLIGTEEKEVKPTVVYKFVDDRIPDNVDSELKKFVGELEPGSGPSFRENENFYFILQRYELGAEDLKAKKQNAANILSMSEIEKFFNGFEKKYVNDFEVNEKMLDKYSVKKMAERVARYKPKAEKKRNFPF